MNKLVRKPNKNSTFIPQIEKIYSFSSLLKSEAQIFFIDIEETILAPNIFYELTSCDSYREIFLDICSKYKNIKGYDILYYGKNFKRKLMEKIIPSVLEEIKKQGKMIFALTSGCPSMQKKDKIREHGVQFNGYLFTRGAEKGPFLVNFLERNRMYERCAFVDNHIEKIINVKNSYYKLLQKPLESKGIVLDNIKCYLYSKNYVSNISKYEFTKYWNSVIDSIKNGGLDSLKRRIDRETIIKRRRKLEGL
jgi:hypothetical protein